MGMDWTMEVVRVHDPTLDADTTLRYVNTEHGPETLTIDRNGLARKASVSRKGAIQLARALLMWGRGVHPVLDAHRDNDEDV